MTIEIRRKREGEGCRLGLLGYEAGLILGFAVHTLRDQGPLVDLRR
jgi:hypothetical protein